MFKTRDALDAMYVGGANCRIENEEITIWREDFPQPTKEEIQAKIVELQAEYEANQYQRDRAVAYPSYADQLDMLYHQGIEGWKAEIKKVKDAHPKPE